MTSRQHTANPAGIFGVKALITAAALSATLAGWAALSAQAPPPVVPAPAPTNVSVAVAPPPAWLRRAPEIPALPPVATAQTAPPAMVAVPRPGAQPAAVAAPPEPVAAAPAPAAPLREVAAPPPPAPAPVTTTRSSR